MIDWLDRIPANLDECFEALNFIVAKDEIEKFKKVKEEDCHYGHMGLGMQLRNSWGLWSGGELKEWFNSKGIYHADDMSGIIFTSYHRYLNGKDLTLDEQIKHYREYWDRVCPSVNEGKL